MPLEAAASGGADADHSADAIGGGAADDLLLRLEEESLLWQEFLGADSDGEGGGGPDSPIRRLRVTTAAEFGAGLRRRPGPGLLPWWRLRQAAAKWPRVRRRQRPLSADSRTRRASLREQAVELRALADSDQRYQVVLARCEAVQQELQQRLSVLCGRDSAATTALRPPVTPVPQPHICEAVECSTPEPPLPKAPPPPTDRPQTRFCAGRGFRDLLKAGNDADTGARLRRLLRLR
eukprot:TRINITY_DN30063_c0_g1_i1.p2 TRINITY_DN30063_c0_g1~~TRINITY_DN30063_c0_g1_i1.p2  ORF type:complete len:249 (+),score=86.91 TRINITY_DN30063_c0_g1_i1:45-749(+)